jgi:ankyrin repeat protein
MCGLLVIGAKYQINAKFVTFNMVDYFLKKMSVTITNYPVYYRNYRKKSPLFVAVGYGHMDIVKYLLSFGADVNLCDSDGHSPLFIASKEGHCDIVKYLVAHNADVNLCDDFGQSPLFIASEEGHCDIVKYLVANNADVNLYHDFGQSPLSIASKDTN